MDTVGDFAQRVFIFDALKKELNRNLVRHVALDDSKRITWPGVTAHAQLQDVHYNVAPDLLLFDSPSSSLHSSQE
eukprot:1011338-Pleurochrysis_carterae.AAC.1